MCGDRGLTAEACDDQDPAAILNHAYELQAEQVLTQFSVTFRSSLSLTFSDDGHFFGHVPAHFSLTCAELPAPSGVYG